MPSIRAKFFNTATRLTVRRRRWGRDETELAHVARRIFGWPKLLRNFWSIGLEIKNDEGLKGEWIIPAGAPSDTVIFYIHGGGFVSCSPRTHRPITTSLARKTGLMLFAIDYRLAPEHRYPAGLDDVFAAYKQLRESAGTIVLAGDSAGGGSVLSLLLRIRDSGLEAPACAVCFSPWTDLTPRGPDCPNAESDAMFYPENMAEFAAVYLAGASDRDPLVSPVFADLDDLPPVLFQASSTEILLEDSRRVYEKILKSEGSAELQIFDGLLHCWQMLNGFVPEAGRALRQAAEFIKRHI